MMAIGKNLKYLLKQQSMTIKELSERSNISLSTLYAITQRDSFNVRIETLKKIADVLDVTTSDLLVDVTKHEPDPDVKQAMVKVFGKKEAEDIRLFTVLDDAVSDIPLKEQLLRLFEELNTEGREELLKQAELLVASRKYKKRNPVKVVEDESWEVNR
jgi:transcriptional regulator with XRE-family HTH domain